MMQMKNIHIYITSDVIFEIPRVEAEEAPIIAGLTNLMQEFPLENAKMRSKKDWFLCLKSKTHFFNFDFDFHIIWRRIKIFCNFQFFPSDFSSDVPSYFWLMNDNFFHSLLNTNLNQGVMQRNEKFVQNSFVRQDYLEWVYENLGWRSNFFWKRLQFYAPWKAQNKIFSCLRNRFFVGKLKLNILLWKFNYEKIESFAISKNTIFLAFLSSQSLRSFWLNIIQNLQLLTHTLTNVSFIIVDFNKALTWVKHSQLRHAHAISFAY